MSVDLANSSHFDINDGGQSYAIWTIDRKPKQEVCAYFLVLDYNIAIELFDGVFIN